MLEVKMDRIPSGIHEKRVLNPTMKMVEFALRNAGFLEGAWVLKAPHRTRKKGAERFRAIRSDGTGFRVRCKPGGNDTCYEWTLCPPPGMDHDLIFSELCSLHPNTMRSTNAAKEDADIPSFIGLMSRMADMKPEILPPMRIERASPQEEASGPNEEASGPNEEASEGKVNKSEMIRGFFEKNPDSGSKDCIKHFGKKGIEIKANLVSIVRGNMGTRPKEEAARPKNIAAETAPSVKAAVLSSTDMSLDLSKSDMPLSSDHAMDRVLVAFGILSEGESFVKRNVLSEGLPKLLNLGGLIGRSDKYGSIKGAMRSLLMACCSAEYMERIMYGENSTNGYRLTEKGKERLELLKASGLGSQHPKMPESHEPPETQDVVNEPKSNESRSQQQVNERISLLKELILEHDSLKKNMDELRQLIKELEDETEDEQLKLSGLENAIAEKTLQREELDKDITRLGEKMELLRAGATKRDSDMRELWKEMDEVLSKKSEIESKLETGQFPIKS